MIMTNAMNFYATVGPIWQSNVRPMETVNRAVGGGGGGVWGRGVSGRGRVAPLSNVGGKSGSWSGGEKGGWRGTGGEGRPTVMIEVGTSQAVPDWKAAEEMEEPDRWDGLYC